MKRIRMATLVLIVLLPLGFAACTPTTNCLQAGLPTTVAYKQLSGIAPNLLSLDVYSPPGSCNAPVVMWVHGGGYQNGDKANGMADKKKLFNGKGWVLISVNYRLTDPGQPGSAKFPDHYDDVAASVAWVKANVGRYGGNPAKIALLGHSAGADIVSNVATNTTYLGRLGLPLSTLACTGPLDTEGFDKVAAADNGEDLQWQLALGNEPNYKVLTSAMTHLKPGKGIGPTIGVYRGTAQRQAIEKAFLDKVATTGVTATRIDARSLSHGEVNSRIGAPGDTVMTPPLVAFLTTCFA